MNSKIAGLAVLGLIGLAGYFKNAPKIDANDSAVQAAREEVREIFAQTAQENTKREIAEQVKAQLQEREARTWTEPECKEEAPQERAKAQQAPEEDDASISVIDMAKKLCDEADKLLAERAERLLQNGYPVIVTNTPQGGCNCAPRLDAIEKKLASLEAKFNVPLKGETAPPVPTKTEPVKAEATAPAAPPASPKLYFNPMTGTYSTEQAAAPLVVPVAPSGVVCENGVCQVPPANSTATEYVYNPATGTYDASVFSRLPATIAVATMEATCESCGPVRRVLGACFPRISGRIRANRGR